MGLKDAFKGDKWYKPLGTSHHGGGAYEGRGKSKEDAEKKAQERGIASEVNKRKAQIRSCKKCQKQGVCKSHVSASKFIARWDK